MNTEQQISNSDFQARKNLARDNHFIPQMYQIGWSDDGINIWEYRTLVHDRRFPTWMHRPMKSTGVWRNLYVRVSDSTEQDDFEHMLNERFESPAVTPLRLACEGKPLSSGDWKAISRFICAQHVRTPGFYFDSLEINKPYIEEALSEMGEDIRAGKSEQQSDIKNVVSNSPNAKFNELVPVSMTVFDYDANHAGVKFEVTIGKGAWLFEMQHHLEDDSILMQTLCSYEWSVVDAPKGVIWPTSDKPLVLGAFLPNGGTTCVFGINEAHILIFPISSTKLLVVCPGEKLPLHFTASAEGAKLFRELIVKNAFLYIYSSCEDDDIKRIRQRVVNNEEASRIAKELRAWYDVYNEVEAPLLGREPNIIDNRSKANNTLQP